MTAEQLVESEWGEWSTQDGQWTFATLKTATALDSAKTLRRIEGLLRGITMRLDTLGTEGLHYILRNEAARRRRAERALRTKRANARKKAAQA